MKIDYSSISSIKEYLRACNFAMQKKWGQNFLIDEKVRIFLLKSLQNIKGLSVWEVGPGLGAMTHLLQKLSGSLTLFEIDKGFINYLSLSFKNCDNLKIVKGDVLKTWKVEMKESGMPKVFFSCLPYNISISLLQDFFVNGAIFEKMLVTVQKEVAQKMLASKGESSYCPLAVCVQYFYNARKVCDIPPSAFWPQPHVHSSAVLLEKKTDAGEAEKIFVKLVCALFASRRRTAKNNLLQFLKMQNKAHDAYNEDIVNRIFESLNLSSKERAEDFSVDTFIEINKKVMEVI